MSNTSQLQWRLLVTPGHVWQARLNAITWLGVVLLTLFAVSLTRDIYGNTIGLVSAVAKAEMNAPPSWWERFKAAPWTTVKTTVTGKGSVAAAPRPTVNTYNFSPFPPDGLDPATLVKPSELKAYVGQQLAALESTGKISSEYATEPLESLTRGPWVGKTLGTPEIPLVKISADGDTIWFASVVAADESGYSVTVTPWLGVFHKADGSWSYYNVDFGQQSARVAGQKTINLQQVAYQVAKDFPDMIDKPVTDNRRERDGDVAGFGNEGDAE